MNIIYPTIKSKYKGSYAERNGKWPVTIRYDDIRFHATRSTEEEAFDLLKEKNIEFGSPIRNIIHKVDGHFEVELTQDKRMKFDEQDLEVIQQHVIYAYQPKKKKTWYACTMLGGRVRQFHTVLMTNPPDGETVDHVSRNGLDNRRNNLRYATPRQQAINRTMRRTNTSGHTGVGFHKRMNAWVANWCPDEGKMLTRAFSVSIYGDEMAKEMAIICRMVNTQAIADYNI
jgi:hypothetical protein